MLMVRTYLAVAALSLSVLGICLAEVPLYEAGKVTEQFSVSVDGPIYPFDLYGDLMVHSLYNTNDAMAPPYISIKRRDSNGAYNEIATINEVTKSPITNGDWVAVPIRDVSTKWIMFKLENDQPVLKQNISVDVSYKNVGFFANNVLVGENIGASQTNLDIFVYDGTNWAFDTSIDIGDHTVASPSDYALSPDRKFVVTSNSTSVNIWQFQTDSITFTMIESFEYDSSYKFNQIIYNGVGTVIGMAPANKLNSGSTALGVFLIYTSVNGKWIQTQASEAQEYGLRSPATLGVSGAFIHENSFVLTAYSENSDANPAGDYGKCVVFVRNGLDVTWSEAYQIQAVPGDNVAFGLNAVLNDKNDLIVPGFILNKIPFPGYFYSTCMTSNIDVTCNEVDVKSCKTALPIELLYTINSSPDCGAVNATLIYVADEKDNKILVDFKFTKPFGKDVTCTSVVKCPATTPISTPTVTTTSSASFAQFNVAWLLAAYLAIYLIKS